MHEVTITQDLLLLLVVLGGVAAAWLLAHLARAAWRLRCPALPSLPDDDCAPEGLGRLVPEGPQVLHEARRGAVALELWLTASYRRRLATGAPGVRLPRQRTASRAESGATADRR